uniref:Uncharacterized protein n=1 Tax=Lotus japonicus TaxID=34305 RepID=I3SC05_LOTJA|nr:unknown [Lotus japonicus]
MLFSITLRELPMEVFSSPKPPVSPTLLKAIQTPPAFGQTSKSKPGNLLSMLFMPKALSSFVRFGMLEGFQIQLISQTGKHPYLPRTSHSNRKYGLMGLM